MANKPTTMRAYERLLKYVTVSSPSNPDSPSCPSTKETWDMAECLKKEMENLGLTDITLDENCYLYATIPANCEKTSPVIGFIAHMDVSCDAPSDKIKPTIIENYDGREIPLGNNSGAVISPSDNDYLKHCLGKTLIVTDGTTLLGADDKAGIAEILTMAERLLTDDTIKHGTIKIAFTPDEEIGRGADKFNIELFGADFAYTVDGGPFGEISYETFNAASVEAIFKGISVHPGTAKNIMINSQLAAMELFSMLPAAERPEHTEEREGFFLLLSSEGNVEKTVHKYIIRDHDYALLKKRIALISSAAQFINCKYKEDTVTLKIEESYRNMAEEVLKHPQIIERACTAVRKTGGTPQITAVRGGTDGSKLSFMGLPCPNLGTGSGNHHGRMEFACAEEMDKTTAMLIEIARA